MIIRKATKNDVETLAYQHEKIFNDFFMASLGHSFLKAYYRTAVDFNETICLIAEDEDKNCIGFVFGRIKAKGYLKRLLKKGFFRFALCGVKLMFTCPKALMRLANNLDKKDKKEGVEDNQDYAEIGLIGVVPEQKGHGIGHQLLYAFEEEMKKMGASRLSLTTDYYNNDNTLTAYKAWGFSVLYDFTAYPNRRMYRLIKEVK